MVSRGYRDDLADGVTETAEDLVQPLTALLLRLEVLQARIRDGDIDELPEQIAALRASAERLATCAGATRDRLAS